MCFLGAVFLFKYLQNGPFFSYGIHIGLIEPCQKYWWTFFLYIQNYYNFQYDESLVSFESVLKLRDFLVIRQFSVYRPRGI